jgi:hypothetical protein
LTHTYVLLCAYLICSLAQGRRLDSRPVVELVKLFLDAYGRSDVFKTSSLPERWQDMHEGWVNALQPGEHLTGDDVLELLEVVTQKG